MQDNWTKYQKRLKVFANNRNHGGCGGVAFLRLRCFVTDGVLRAWERPARTPLEPRDFDPAWLRMEETKDWYSAIGDLKRGTNGHCPLDRVLVVRDGEPVGWLKDV